MNKVNDLWQREVKNHGWIDGYAVIAIRCLLRVCIDDKLFANFTEKVKSAA